jgi:hypothetical protein
MFSFKLNEEFVAEYKSKESPFGYKDAAGNSVGEITFLRTYSRKKEDGTKETWAEVCEPIRFRRTTPVLTDYLGQTLRLLPQLKSFLTRYSTSSGALQVAAFGLWVLTL